MDCALALDAALPAGTLTNLVFHPPTASAQPPSHRDLGPLGTPSRPNSAPHVIFFVLERSTPFFIGWGSLVGKRFQAKVPRLVCPIWSHLGGSSRDQGRTSVSYALELQGTACES